MCWRCTTSMKDYNYFFLGRKRKNLFSRWPTPKWNVMERGHSWEWNSLWVNSKIRIVKIIHILYLKCINQNCMQNMNGKMQTNKATCIVYELRDTVKLPIELRGFLISIPLRKRVNRGGLQMGGAPIRGFTLISVEQIIWYQELSIFLFCRKVLYANFALKITL